ncbi:MAG: sigma-54-dependent Fis family transcriptional regulator [Sphingobacteriia bacterium]|nr:sigma-54-dependent Fis family transcriptional regulator [Sphingobacteriia bacterium]
MRLNKARILVIDDDADVLTAVRVLLRTEVKEVLTEKNPEQIPYLFMHHVFDLVLLDMNFNASINTGNEGIYWLKRMREIKPDIQVIMITAYGDIDLAVCSLKEGAADFIVKPWHNEKLLSTMEAVLSNQQNREEKTKRQITAPGINIIGRSEEMEDIFIKISKIAPTEANVLILGENGTGKDLIATAVHEQSLRKNHPFVKVDVGALTESLFESELFGHKKGAFTDAREDRIGRFESANGGTLFLDEIGNITLHQQARLLSVLQNRQVTRLGSNEPVPVNIRLICATNLPLSELANENRFRKDLIYRINTVEIMVPPLRKRKADIPLLAEHFARIYASRYLRPDIHFHSSALEKLKDYHYPGNVRELQYTIERAVIMTDGAEIRAADLLFSPLESATVEDAEEGNTQLSDIEKKTIRKVVDKHNGNITRAAKELGITRTALYRRLSKYDI